MIDALLEKKRYGDFKRRAEDRQQQSFTAKDLPSGRTLKNMSVQKRKCHICLNSAFELEMSPLFTAG